MGIKPPLILRKIGHDPIKIMPFFYAYHLKKGSILQGKSPLRAIQIEYYLNMPDAAIDKSAI